MTTQLEIINAMLAVNGVAGVSSASSTNPAAIAAKNKLAIINKRVQARGWYFNKETIQLSPNLSGEVILPQNTLYADPVDTTSQYVKRGTRLYDKGNNTYTISADVKCELILQLDIDELPETAAAYIMDKAVKDFYVDDDGDLEKVSKLENRENESFAYLQREELASVDVNIRRSQLGIKLLANTSSNQRYVPRGE